MTSASKRVATGGATDGAVGGRREQALDGFRADVGAMGDLTDGETGLAQHLDLVTLETIVHGSPRERGRGAENGDIGGHGAPRVAGSGVYR